MLTEYVATAMNRAKYELMEDGTYFGRIPGFKGVWGNAKTVEGCHVELQEVLEGWLILKLEDGDTDIPEINGIKIALPNAIS